jgi:nucleoside-diphosphate-sugar epimerase|tara:strand:- start:1052 stop:1861 length:810 start_codon:yes stop_codon:yes gene_type:complete
MKTVLVLGSSGVVGTALCKVLRREKYDVVEWDIKNSYTQDLSNPINNTRLREMVNKSDFVFFLAYDVGGSKYLKNITHDFINRNVMLMMNTFNVIGNKPCIFMSSQMQNMSNTYGVLKLLGEHYMQSMNGISVRLWNVYGPEVVDEKSHVITDFIHMYKKNKSIHMLTDGTEKRQFLHTNDCADALICMMNNLNEILTEKKVVDLTNFEWVDIKGVANIIAHNGNITFTDKKDTTQTKCNEPDDFILKYWKPIINLKTGIQTIIDGQST